jgi:hypothetical protein
LYDRATSIFRVYKEQPLLGIGTSSLRCGESSMLSTPSSPSVGGSCSAKGVPPAAKMSWTTFESAARGDDREWGVPMIRTVPALAVIAGLDPFFHP